MSEVFFYGGIVLAIVFFILTVFFFFRFKIPRVIRYFLRRENKKISSQKGGGSHVSSPIKRRRPVMEQSNSTEVLDIAQNYATALLDADRTELLPELDK